MWAMIFGVTALITWALLWLLEPRGGSAASRRLAWVLRHQRGDEAQDPGALPESVRRPSLEQRLVGLVEQGLQGRGLADRFERRLQAVEWQWRSAEFMTARGLLAVSGAGLAAAMTPGLALSLWWGLPAVGWFLPLFLLKRAEQTRLKRFEVQLPDALGMIANALRSGYSLLQAMESVSREMPAPISREFSLVLQELRLNVPLEEALAHLVERVPSDDLDLMVTAILIQRQVGGNLSEVLDKIRFTVTERIRLQGEVRALTAQGRLSGKIVTALPFALAGIMSMLAPGYLDPLLGHPLGWAMLAGGLIMQVVGALTIRKMTNLEV